MARWTATPKALPDQNGRFACTLRCGAFVSRRADINRHLKTCDKAIEKVKPYKCPYCSHRTSQRSNLQTHVNTHTGAKPLVCKLCVGKTTRPVAWGDPSELTRHKQKYHPAEPKPKRRKPIRAPSARTAKRNELATPVLDEMPNREPRNSVAGSPTSGMTQFQEPNTPLSMASTSHMDTLPPEIDPCTARFSPAWSPLALSDTPSPPPCLPCEVLPRPTEHREIRYVPPCSYTARARAYETGQATRAPTRHLPSVASAFSRLPTLCEVGRFSHSHKLPRPDSAVDRTTGMIYTFSPVTRII